MKKLKFKKRIVTVEWRGLLKTRIQDISNQENFIIGNVYFQKLISQQ